MYTIRKIFKFEMSHKLTSCYSQSCKNFHGHSYLLELFFSSDKLNKDGMVIDFGEVKDRIGYYIDSWDHALVLNKEDEWVKTMSESGFKFKVLDYNPTAENMCKDMYTYIKNSIPELTKVRLHETTTGWAEYYE